MANVNTVLRVVPVIKIRESYARRELISQTPAAVTVFHAKSEITTTRLVKQVVNHAVQEIINRILEKNLV